MTSTITQKANEKAGVAAPTNSRAKTKTILDKESVTHGDKKIYPL